MKKISLDYSKLDKFITKEELEAMQSNLVKANEDLVSRSGKGNDFLGWLDLPVDYDKDEYLRIKKAADYIKKNAKVLVVIGIGGSYLGAKAVLENLNHTFYNELKDKNTPDIYFAGQNISGRYLKHLIEIIGDRDFCINVISKSGTTTEPAIAFRAFKKFNRKKYGKEEAKKRIFATTDKARGVLKTLADKEGYETFVIADDVGGRYSVLSAVGLLPIACAGIDIDALMSGAQAAREDSLVNDFSQNICYQYASLRNILYKKITS